MKLFLSRPTRKIMMSHLRTWALLVSTIASPATAESNEYWYVEEFGDSFVATVNGGVTWGDRLSVRFVPTECHYPSLFFTAMTAVEDPPWESLKVVDNSLPVTWNGELFRAELMTIIPFLMNEIAFIHVGHYTVFNLTELVKSYEAITLEIVDFNFFVASEFFDVPTNQWTTNGASAALTEAYSLCVLVEG